MSLTFITFELLIYLLFLVCLAHAWRAGAAVVWQLLAGVLFGVLLEYATIQQLHTYEYGRFMIMLGEVPLAIGVAWGCIVYSARLFSGTTSLPVWARPLLDALIALNIDLSMDAIAIRLGFWNWAIDINSEFFGVPFGNFWAWFWVVFFFSAGLSLVRTWKQPIAAWLAPLGAVVIGVAGVLLTNRLIVSIHGRSYSVYLLVIGAVLGGALLLILLLRPRLHQRPEPPPAIWVPVAFHAYFLIAGTLAGIFFQTPAILLVSLAMAGIGAALHRSALLPAQTLPSAPGPRDAG